MIGRVMLRSIESNIRAFVKFTNSSERHVEIHWINFKGENIHYTNLNPGGSCTVSSCHCTSYVSMMTTFSHPKRSTRSVPIHGSFSVHFLVNGCKLTGKKSSNQKLGSSSSTKLIADSFPLEGKTPKFTFHLSRCAMLACGDFSSLFSPKTMFTILKFQKLWEPICFTFSTCQRDSQKTRRRIESRSDMILTSSLKAKQIKSNIVLHKEVLLLIFTF